ncbi:hypothetical protein [Tropicibacter naphthalenivorans]|uniref:Uncharacterized protein n=1 Tax=Tropicibacter naphthalenivorans TaxID=441103 RepID=A0A0P1GW02_9RHOB|nr:hypothetical protein [Tropicibacter naphthalenivorans]CUH80077.1 hypothetical protein TRN7648_02797 [Tropicibacter naphthalenivorans]SMC84380.1 hypothetical protein SAMN04488093_10566 [Tropicibacter naphthalenivorans]
MTLSQRFFFLVLVGAALATAQTLRAQTVNLNTGKIDFAQEAGARVDVTIVRGITRSDQLPAPLVAVRKRLSAKRYVRFADLRALADYGDGNAAFQLAKRIDYVARPQLAADAAHYYGMAAQSGRGGAIYGFIRAVDALDPASTSQARLTSLRKTLLLYAAAGSGPATEAMLRYYVAGAPFGDLGPDLDRLVVQTDSPAANAVALQLASQILHAGGGDAASLGTAKGYLDKVAGADSLRLRLIAENLLPLVNEQIAALPPQLSQDMPNQEVSQ